MTTRFAGAAGRVEWTSPTPWRRTSAAAWPKPAWPCDPPSTRACIGISDLIAGYDAIIVDGPLLAQLLPGVAIARYGRE